MFANAQLPRLKLAAVWFDKRIIFDTVGASWDTVGADHVARMKDQRGLHI